MFGILKALFCAGFGERGRKIALRSYNLLLLIAFGMVATLVFSVINRDHGIAGWLLGLSLVEGMLSALYAYVIRHLYDKSLAYALCAVVLLWIPTEIICAISVIMNLGKTGSAVGSGGPHGLLVKGVVLTAGLLIVASPVLVLPEVRKEWALSRKAEMMISYDASVCYLIVDHAEIRVEMSPRFFWTKNVASLYVGARFRDEEECKEDGSYRVERKEDRLRVFRDGELLYEFEVPSYVHLVMLYFPPRVA